MNKLLALLLALLMLLSSLSVLAEDSRERLPDFGMALAYPEAFEHAEYSPSFSFSGIVSRDPFVAIMYFNYYAVPNGTLADRANQIDQNDPEALERFYKLLTTIGLVVVTDAESLDAALSAVGGSVTEDMVVTEFGTVDSYHYYYITSADNEDYLAGIADQEDAEKVRADMKNCSDAFQKCLQDAELFAPVDVLAAAVGQSVAFETTDLDGNAVNTADLFKENKITMVNFWGSWCRYCVKEMPQLAEIHTRLREKGCGIVGIEYERGKAVEEFKDDALSIMKESGTNYPNVLAPKEPFNFIQGYPCTVFVDSEGTILAYPISGAQVDLYEPTIDQLLAGESVETPVNPTSADRGEGEYHIIVSDEEGPVQGVAIQFCDESTCSFQVTDENGIATFRPDVAKEYDVHILQVPDGYAENDELYKTQETWSDLNIVIKKAN